MANEYMVQSIFHGDGKVIAAYIDNNGEVQIDMYFPNSESLRQREYPYITTFSLQAFKDDGAIVSNDAKITNKMLRVELAKIAESATMPRYSERFPLARLSTVYSPPNREGHYQSHCFACKKRIDSNFDIKCKICGWYICPICRACYCSYKGSI